MSSQDGPSAEPEQEPEEPVDSKSHEKSERVTLLLKATGDTPIMQKRKWIVEPDKRIGSVIEFMRKYLKLHESESLMIAEVKERLGELRALVGGFDPSSAVDSEFSHDMLNYLE